MHNIGYVWQGLLIGSVFVCVCVCFLFVLFILFIISFIETHKCLILQIFHMWSKKVRHDFYWVCHTSLIFFFHFFGGFYLFDHYNFFF